MRILILMNTKSRREVNKIPILLGRFRVGITTIKLNGINIREIFFYTK
jgi:hypothetical protein